jgi:hypothetical protein
LLAAVAVADDMAVAVERVEFPSKHQGQFQPMQQ